MPRVHYVKKARKSYKDDGIKKGESYYWWKFRYGGKIRSTTAPKPSQLTQSDFLSSVYSAQESLADPGATLDDIRSTVETVVDELNSLRDETQDKYDNQPEGLQDGPVAELLQGRVDSLEEMINDLEAVDIPDEPDEDESEEDAAARVQEELSNIEYTGE